jgi:P4 family phage/plasmid primase-like protien
MAEKKLSANQTYIRNRDAIQTTDKMTETVRIGDDFTWFQADKREIDEAIRLSIGSKGGHYDVACVMKKLFVMDGMPMVAYEDKHWYLYSASEHRWYVSPDPTRLSKYVSLASVLYSDWAREKMATAEDDAEAEHNQAKDAFKIALDLRRTAYKSYVIKEMSAVCYWDGNESIATIMDSNAHILHFKNGVYDFVEGRYRKGKPTDFCSLSTRIDYKPWVEHSPDHQEGILDYLRKVFPDEGMRRYMLRCVAKALNGLIKEEVFYMLNGSGSNSKSRYMSLIQLALGDYYQILPIALLTQKRQASNSAQSSLVMMKGRRIAVLQEPSAGEEINVGLLKELTGNDRITCRGLYKEPIEFSPFIKMFLTCNDLPTIKADDGGTWRRIKVMEFISKFKDGIKHENTDKHIYKMDTSLNDKMEHWGGAFMSYLLDVVYPAEYKNRDLPPSVVQATAKYQKMGDIVSAYISDNLLVMDEPQTKAIDKHSVFMDYRTYIRESNLQDNTSRNDFYKKLVDRLSGMTGATGEVVYKHIKIRRYEAENDEEADEASVGDAFTAWFRNRYETGEQTDIIPLESVIGDFFTARQDYDRDSQTEYNITAVALKPLLHTMGMTKVRKNVGNTKPTMIVKCKIRLN